MLTRRLMAAPAMACTLLAAASAAAQSRADLVGPVERAPEPATRSLPDFRPPADDLRRPGEPRRNGLIAAWPVNDDLQIGIGRFRIIELDSPRTNTEHQRQPTSVRHRERGVAAVGFSLRF